MKHTAEVNGNHTSYSLVVDEGSVFLGDCNIMEKIVEKPKFDMDIGDLVIEDFVEETDEGKDTTDEI